MRKPFGMPRLSDFLLEDGGFRPRHNGAGQKRAAVRLKAHREQQAARVAPALEALATRRAALTGRRWERWIDSDRAVEDMPRHIRNA